MLCCLCVAQCHSLVTRSLVTRSSVTRSPVTRPQVYDIIQAQLLASPGYDVVVDTGDSLWRTPRLKLPRGAAYETQVRVPAAAA